MDRAISHGTPIPQFAIDRARRAIYQNNAPDIYSGIKAEDVLGTNRHPGAFFRLITDDCFSGLHLCFQKSG